MATVEAITESKITGVVVTLTLEEAQELRQIFYAALDANAAYVMGLTSLVEALDSAGIRPRHPDGRFSRPAVRR